MRKIIKAWGVVNEYGLTFGDVEPSNGEFGSGLSFPNVSTNKKLVQSWALDPDERIVQVTIAVELPAKSKRA